MRPASFSFKGERGTQFPMFHELQRFVWWLGQGQNSTVVLVLITFWYTFLTHRIMKASTRQAVASFQPALLVCGLSKRDGKPTATYLYVKNLGTQPVVFLDFTVRCSPHGRSSILDRQIRMDDTILSGGDNITLDYDFSDQLSTVQVSSDMCGYHALIVVSDLGRQVVLQYDYFQVSGITMCRLGMPMRVRWKYASRPWRWRYYRFKHWLRIAERLAEWENADAGRRRDSK